MTKRTNSVRSIKLKKYRHYNRYLVELTNGNIFEISEQTLIEQSIIVEKNISEVEFEEILQAEEINSAKHSALSLLSYRPRSEKEIKDRLKEKGYKTSIVSSTINYLKTKDWIDDKNFGLAYARDQLKKNNLGPIALKYKIKNFIDSEDLINEIIQISFLEINVQDIIIKVLSKFDREKIKSDLKLRRKLINKLKSKGHYWDDINEAIQSYESGSV